MLTVPTDSCQDGGGVVKRSGKLPGLSGFEGLRELDQLLQQDVVVGHHVVLLQHLLFQSCKARIIRVILLRQTQGYPGAKIIRQRSLVTQEDGLDVGLCWGKHV